MVIAPKAAFFTGLILFFRSDVVVKEKVFDIDIGGSLALPLTGSYPFEPITISSPADG